MLLREDYYTTNSIDEIVVQRSEYIDEATYNKMYYAGHSPYFTKPISKFMQAYRDECFRLKMQRIDKIILNYLKSGLKPSNQ